MPGIGNREMIVTTPPSRISQSSWGTRKQIISKSAIVKLLFCEHREERLSILFINEVTQRVSLMGTLGRQTNKGREKSANKPGMHMNYSDKC